MAVLSIPCSPAGMSIITQILIPLSRQPGFTMLNCRHQSLARGHPPAAIRPLSQAAVAGPA